MAVGEVACTTLKIAALARRFRGPLAPPVSGLEERKAGHEVVELLARMVLFD
jgi:hypothetical protein